MALCRTIYGRWNSEEYEEFFALMSPDIEWVEGYNPEVGVYHGREGGRRWFATTSGAFAEPRFEPLRFIDRDDAVVIEVLFHGRGMSSGVATTARLAHAVRIRDGMVAYLGAFPHVEQALKAVGLAG